MQGPQSHTNLIRKEQNLWQGRDHQDPEEAGISQEQNSSIHNLLSQSYSFLV